MEFYAQEADQTSIHLKFSTGGTFLLRIRLTRMGAKKKPAYRIVVIEKSSARDGRFIEVLGHYNPKKKPVDLKLDKEKYAYWVSKGAQPSETVRGLMTKVG